MKVKSRILDGALKGYKNQVRGWNPTTNLDLYYRIVKGEIVMSLKSKPPERRSPQQQFRGWLWCIVDQMFRNLSLGQFSLWKRYYWRKRAQGKTVKTSVKRGTKSPFKETGRNMGYYAYFMKKGLHWDFLEFFWSWLKAKWRVNHAYVKGTDIIVEFQIVHRERVKIAREPRILRAERIRW